MAVAYLQAEPSPQILRYRAARSVPCAGDLVDVFPCAGHLMNIVIADVCGQDARAQEYARYLRHAIRALADDRSPARLLESVNRALYRRIADAADERFASVFVATLKGPCLTYASAGHDVAMLMRAGGHHRHLPPTGVIVGINAAEGYEERALVVGPGDWLVLATDGVTEARDAQGAFFGTRGVVRNAHTAIEAGFDDPAARILEAAQKHGSGRFVDDASVLCVRFS